ncbi:hypothetical protein CRUP_036485, partial [Coryphaenoides rupestris]
MALESRITQEEVKKEPEKPVDREKFPCLVRTASLFSGRHHRGDEFARGNVPSSELQIYTCLVKEVYPDARKKGTHFSFATVYPDQQRPGYRRWNETATASQRVDMDMARAILGILQRIQDGLGQRLQNLPQYPGLRTRRHTPANNNNNNNNHHRAACRAEEPVQVHPGQWTSEGMKRGGLERRVLQWRRGVGAGRWCPPPRRRRGGGGGREVAVSPAEMQSFYKFSRNPSSSSSSTTTTAAAASFTSFTSSSSSSISSSSTSIPAPASP